MIDHDELYKAAVDALGDDAFIVDPDDISIIINAVEPLIREDQDNQECDHCYNRERLREKVKALDCATDDPLANDVVERADVLALLKEASDGDYYPEDDTTTGRLSW
jgi:hypothetical protein